MAFAMQGEEKNRNNCTFDSIIFGIFVENSHSHRKTLPKRLTEKGTGDDGRKETTHQN